MMIPFDPRKFDFTVEEAKQAGAEYRLLSAEIEFTRACNYMCPYCYAAGDLSGTTLDTEAAESAIRQVAGLGARKIVILGGEPLLYGKLEQMVGFITGLGMGAEIFTNGALMTAERARFFFEHGCRVVVKLNSLRPGVQERLTGIPGALEKALRAISLLRDAGFTEDMLCASSVISSENVDDVEPLWAYLRENGIRPYLEIMTPQGRLLEQPSLQVGTDRLHTIFDDLSRYDRCHGCGSWDPQPPLVGSFCMRHLYSCVIGIHGDVTPCVGLTTVLGNIHDTPLADILRNSRILEKLRDYRNTIKGPCRTCDKADRCYGCRGSAYQLTGDYLASDPLCWKNRELLDRPPAVPAQAGDWIPHKPPMTMVDRILAVSEWNIVESVIRPDNRFLRDGVLDNDAIPEIAAQACAAVTGFEQNSHELGGFLTALRAIRCLEPVRSGDVLHVEFRQTAHIDNFYTLEFRIRRTSDGVICADGEISTCEFS